MYRCVNTIFQTGKVSPEDLKEKLSKCGKLEELKSQLAKMKETKAKLKTTLPKPKGVEEPKLKQFDKLTVEVEAARLVLILTGQSGRDTKIVDWDLNSSPKKQPILGQ